MTKKELENLSHEELIEIILDLQNELGGFDDENEESWEDLDDEYE